MDRREERPHPRERFARQHREAWREWDREPVGRYGRAGFGYGDYHGAYADRPGYTAPFRSRRPPQPDGSGWPNPVRELPREAEERHRRAMRDRELARSVSEALYHRVGSAADWLAVYADDAEITIEGPVPHDDAAEAAYDAARRVPGVRRVRDRTRLRR